MFLGGNTSSLLMPSPPSSPVTALKKLPIIYAFPQGVHQSIVIGAEPSAVPAPASKAVDAVFDA
jgi:hypothetical protein